MSAMTYEFLLRRVYNCGRSGVPGADADVYRKLERAEMHRNDPHWLKSTEEKEYDYRTAFVEVRRFVQKAISIGIEKIGHSLSEDDAQKIAEIKAIVSNHDFLDKAKLEEIMEEADDIFRKAGLEAR